MYRNDKFIVLINSSNNFGYKLINSSFSKSSKFIFLPTYSATQQLQILLNYEVGLYLYLFQMLLGKRVFALE